MTNQEMTYMKFAEYEDKICTSIGVSKGVWRCYRDDIIKFFGFYNKDVTYAGRGDSRKFSFTEWLVPEAFDNFIYYVHDAFYLLIKLIPRIYGCFKERADNIMKEMIKIKANRPTLIDDLYYLAVKWFG